MGTVGPFPVGKATLSRDADHSFHLAPGQWVGAELSPLAPAWQYGTALLLPNNIRIMKQRRMRWAGYVARMRDEKCIQDFTWKAEGTRWLGRRRRGWEDNIKMDLRETGLEGAEWIHLAQNRVSWWALWKWQWTRRVLFLAPRGV
jgi:hypothetical protein